MVKWVQISVIFTLCCTSILAIYLITLVVSLKVLVPHLDAALVSVQAIELNTTRTEAELSGLLNTTRHLAIEERKAQTQQLAQLEQINTHAIALLDSADKGVQQFTESMKSIGLIAPKVNESVSRLTDSSTRLMDSSTALVQTATLTLADSVIHDSLDQIKQSTQNTATATANLAATTKDIKDYVHRETTPVRGTWNAFKAVINFTWSLRGALGY